ncbi:MAG: hypothetical protein WAW91_00795, partial [Candidatus Nanoperiomorbaceae bacterium]
RRDAQRIENRIDSLPAIRLDAGQRITQPLALPRGELDYCLRDATLRASSESRIGRLDGLGQVAACEELGAGEQLA